MAGKVIPMDVKLAAALAVDDLNVREFCRRHGIGKTRFYELRKVFREGGIDAVLNPPSRRPHSSPKLISAEIEDLIVAARKDLVDDGWDGGADSVLHRLQVEGVVPLPSRATIWRVMKRRGLIIGTPSKRPHAATRRFEWSRPNECWQIDSTHWTLSTGETIEIINIIDDHSRVLVRSAAVASCTSIAAWDAFVEGAQQWGLPGHMMSDNGPALNQTRRQINVVFTANLRQLGIQPIASTPYHPQTCGKVERFHQTLKQWLDKHPANTLTELQQLLDTFAEYYNHHRPHRACNRKAPITKWKATPTAGPAEHPIDTPTTITTTIVTRNGWVDAPNWRIAVGKKWVGTNATIIVQHHYAAVFAGHELIRTLTINPTREYQTLYPGHAGRPPDSVRHVSRHNRPL